MEGVSQFDDPEFVRAAFEREDGLMERAAAWQRHRRGPDLTEFVLSAIVPLQPRRVLEVGAGTGEFAQRMIDDLDVEVTAIDQSGRMAEFARRRGVDAVQADVRDLPFAPRSFDMVVANYMLFLVADISVALSEIARVLDDDGCLVAATQTERSLPELWELLGAPARIPWSFSSENGTGVLKRWFADVEEHHADAVLTFADTGSIRDFVAVSLNRGHLTGRVPEQAGPLEASTRDTVFVARNPKRQR